jgi:TRAP-type C4-dicarboxylate transport system substrate-binding protein
MLKKLTIILAASAAAFVATTSAGLAQTKLKWAHVYETSEPFHTSSVWAAQEIAKRTNGRYAIDVYPASQLG